MRKLRTFVVELILVGVMVAWYVLKFPDSLDPLMPWIVWAIFIHLTWEVVLERENVKAFAGAKRRDSRMIWLIAFALGGLVSVGYLSLAQRSIRGVTEYANTHKGVSPTQSSAPVLQTPIVEPRYDLNLIGLPILVPPFKTVNLLLIQDNRTVQTQNFINDRNKDLVWPTKEPIFPPIQAGIVSIANNGNIGVFNVSYSITISIGAQKDPGGVTTVSLNLPLFDLPVGARREFFIVNQSNSLPAVVGLSNTAIAVVQGESERRKIDTKPRNITFFDKIPLLSPSFQKWSGMKLLEPDQRKQQKEKEGLIYAALVSSLYSRFSE
jgi:hypothetical protein